MTVVPSLADSPVTTSPRRCYALCSLLFLDGHPLLSRSEFGAWTAQPQQRSHSSPSSSPGHGGRRCRPVCPRSLLLEHRASLLALEGELLTREWRPFPVDDAAVCAQPRSRLSNAHHFLRLKVIVRLPPVCSPCNGFGALSGLSSKGCEASANFESLVLQSTDALTPCSPLLREA